MAGETTRSGDISSYVTDTTGDVYAITGLPEEVLAVVFAYVSRSPRSFRENLLEVSAERAGAFHEKWVLHYGHASVAEHAAIHLGVERLSRYASAVLEDSRLISVTEYSQRYQEPRAGDVHVPRELEGTPAADAARRCFDALYATYVELLEGLAAHLAREMPRKEGEEDDAWTRRLRRRAFEDARYVLPLATTTSLGLTTNARELEHVISKCLSHDVAEVRRLGEAMRDASRQVAPTLVKYAAPLPYRMSVDRARRDVLASIEAGTPPDTGGPTSCHAEGDAWRVPVELVDWTGRVESRDGQGAGAPGDDGAERAALLAVLGSFLEPGAADPARVRGHLASAATHALRERYRQLLGEPAPHESLPRELESVTYTFHVTLSEAAWHQFLRHRMMASFPGEPRVDLGIKVPPLVREAGLAPLMERAAALSAGAHASLAAVSPVAAAYAVTNAHYRRVRLVMNLRQLHHLTRLRTGKNAQWDIRDVARALLAAARSVHPSLVTKAADADDR